MSATFYVIGYLAIAVGLAWATLGFFQPYPVEFGPGAAILSRALIMSPGFGIIAGGLLFMAIGGVLGRLDVLISLARAKRAEEDRQA